MGRGWREGGEGTWGREGGCGREGGWGREGGRVGSEVGEGIGRGGEGRGGREGRDDCYTYYNRYVPEPGSIPLRNWN